jgi:hypothetical protein
MHRPHVPQTPKQSSPQKTSKPTAKHATQRSKPEETEGTGESGKKQRQRRREGSQQGGGGEAVGYQLVLRHLQIKVVALERLDGDLHGAPIEVMGLQDGLRGWQLMPLWGGRARAGEWGCNAREQPLEDNCGMGERGRERRKSGSVRERERERERVRLPQSPKPSNEAQGSAPALPRLPGRSPFPAHPARAQTIREACVGVPMPGDGQLDRRLVLGPSHPR